MTGKRFKSRCYEKQKNVVIYDEGNKLFDVSYRDFGDAYYLKMKLSPVIDKLNELAEENQDNKAMIEFLSTENTQIMNELKTRTQIQHQLEEENEQLKRQIGNLEHTRDFCADVLADCERIETENKELKRQVKKTIFHIDVMIDVSAPNTERISVLLDLKEKIIETFGEWVIEYD